MYRKFNLMLSIITVAILGAACASTEEKENIGEPNNTILEANMLESGKAHSMKIDSVGDIDWYAIPVNGPGYLRISTKTVPDNLTLNVRFAKKQAWETEKQKWLTNWSKTPKTIPIEKADTLYFALVDDYGDAASDMPIEFKADFLDEFDEFEPNDTSEEAKLVTSGELMQTAFFPKTDQDWFKIKVDKPGYLMIRTKDVPENIKINARYARKASEYAEVEFTENWKKLPAGIQVTKPGIIYFVLIDDYNDQISTTKAEWKIDFIPETDPSEPNNNIEEAFPVAVGDTLRPTIFPLKDTDFFTITPDSTVTVWLHSKGPENIKPQIKLSIKNGFETKALGNWEDLPIQYELKAGNQYYFQLIDDYNDEYSKEPVLLYITPAEKEPAPESI